MSAPSSRNAAACLDFSQHAWKPEVCVNCHRPRSQHKPVATATGTKITGTATRIIVNQSQPQESRITTDTISTSSPVPNKRAATLPRQSKLRSNSSASEGKQDNGSQSSGGDQSELKDGKGQRGEEIGGDGNEKDWSKTLGHPPSKSSQSVESRQRRTRPKPDRTLREENLKAGAPRGILSRRKKSQSKDRAKKEEDVSGSRVAFIDAGPHIIGYDGGIGNVFDDDSPDDGNDEDDNLFSSSSEDNFSLTDEEKSFVLLSLENTVWNSEAKNLLHENASGSSRHLSREFEDLNHDALSFAKHFQNLKDCDATHRYGTFPVSIKKRSSSSKLALDSVFPDSGHGSADLDTLTLDGERGRKGSDSGSRPAMNSADSPGLAYKVVNIVDNGVKDYSEVDSSSLGRGQEGRGQESDSVSENSGNSSGRGHASSSDSNANSPSHTRARGRARPTAIRISTIDRRASPRPDNSAEREGEDYDPLNDSTTAAGLQVLALLNDVLDNYGDNESSTDDGVNAADGGGDKSTSGGKKSTDFEARMASVAANLDLSKQQRSKRPAPRPPSSPPPEPTVSPKKKSQPQSEPVFKMVPMGKAIMAVPPAHDFKSAHGGHTQSLPSFEDMPDEEAERSNGDAGRSKKGITSFFKNILRRGKDSSDSPESNNPEVQFAVKSDLASTSAPSLTDAGSDKKGGESTSAQAKFRVLPQQGGAPAGMKGGSASTGDLPGSAAKRGGEGEGGGEGVPSSGQGKVSSPPPQARSKGLSSPKQILKRTAAKLSPPAQHKVLPHAKDDSPSSPTTPTAKAKPALTSKLSDDKPVGETPSQPTPVRRRAKSPKRIPPPAPPSRPPPSKRGTSEDSQGATTDLTRELEQRLKGASASVGSVPMATAGGLASTKPAAPVLASKSTSQIPKTDSIPSAAVRAEIRKSMTVPPPSPPTAKTTHVSRSPPTSPTPEESDSQPGSPSDDTMSNSDDSPRFVEKIELPTAAPGKKGILGKLNMNRKSRAPAPPLAAIKRARSISDAEKRGKRINPADISGPLPVADGATSTGLENRRNTISLGDDPAFSTASSAAAQSIEKGYDDLDMPILSPLGSLENLYEAILPKEGSEVKSPFYDPPDKGGKRSLCPNVPADGYLEPVGPSLPGNATTDGSQEQKEAPGSVKSSPARTTKDPKLSSGVTPSASAATSVATLPGKGENFVEPELTEERRQLLASQPIYEEIPPFASDTWEDRCRDDDTKSLTSQITQMTDISPYSSSADKVTTPSVHSATLPHPRRKPSNESMPRNRRRGSASHSDSPAPPAALSGATVTHAMTSSMTSALPSSTLGSVTSSPFMTSSMNASLWQSTLAQPVDSNGELLPLPPIPQMTPRSVSKETVSSGESDNQSLSGTLSRPRPAPRRRPKRPDTAGSDQYVSMNRPSAQVALGETKLRETFTRLTALNFQTLHDVYVQSERLLTLDKVAMATSAHLKWSDFDIYGQALHASGRCVVYNAKLKANNTPCQLMVLHSRPAAEMSLSTHPSLLRPASIFADNVPFSFLTPEFIKTSQLLQNSIYDSSQARCFLAVGFFDIAESLSSHLTLLRETLTHDLGAYLHVLLMTTLQLLSAMSHCLDRGFTVTETDLGDVFHITRHDLRGKVVAFLPHQRTPDVPQGEAMCGFLDRLLQEATNDFYTHDANEGVEPETDHSHLLTTVEQLRILLEPKRIECLAQLRAVVEYTLWGPQKYADNLVGSGSGDAGADNSGSLESVGEMGEGGDYSSVEQDHSAWLERERAAMVARFATSTEGLASGVSLDDFYRLKFLLKSSATSLAECCRRLS